MTTRFVVFLVFLVCATEARSVLSVDSELQDEAVFIRSRARRSAHKLKSVGRKRLSGVSDGSVIVIDGMVAEEAERFNVTLRKHRSNEDSLVISFNIKEEEVTLNSFFSGGWDFPEHRRCPLRAGEEFKIEIVVASNEYLITVNKYWMAQYSHRINYSKLSHAILSGDAVVEKIEHYVTDEADEEEEEEDEEEGEYEEDE